MIINFPFDLMTKNINIEFQSNKVKLLMPKIKKSISVNEALKKIEKRIIKDIRNAKSIAVLIDDHTRPTPTAETLEFLLKEIDGKDIKIIFAKGTHEAPSEEYIKEKVGSKIFKNYNIIIHDAYDENIHDFIGVTKYGTPVWLNKEFLNADFKIGIGSIFPSEIAGFTGGYKIVLPGIAYYETINKNHSMFISPNAECGRINDNPVRLDIDDAGRLSGLNYTIDYVLNPNNGIIKCFAGDPLKEHRKGANFCKKIYGFNIKEEYDLVIVSPGGKEDIDFVQAIKAIFTAHKICKKDGKILLIASCRLGHQWPELIDIAEKIKKENMNKNQLLKEILKNGIESFAGAVMYKLYDIFINSKPKLYIYTNNNKLNNEIATLLNIEIINNPQDFIDKEANEKSKILAMPYAALTLINT